MRNCFSLIILPLLTTITLLSYPKINLAQAPGFGILNNFVLYTTVGAVSSTGISNITGDVGSNDGEITNFDSLHGVIQNANTITAQCSTQLLIIYNQLNNTIATFFPLPVLGNGQVLDSGVYSIPQAASLNDVLTLDAEGNPNAVFIFKIQGAFSTSANSSINLINGALANNVFWVVEGAASMATGTSIKGNIIANNGAISMGADCTLEGRALSTTGAVSVYGLYAYVPEKILPVTLLDFKASRLKYAIELIWTTANEISFAGYELERSANGQNFYNIGSVPSTNTLSINTYSWLDNNPLDGVSFYRLKMLDIDGVFTYSAIVRIDMKAQKSISVYPNPITGDNILLQMYGQSKGEHIINLYTIKGEKVMSSRIIHSGNDAVRSIPLNKKFPIGFYCLEISDPGKNKKVLKILIN